ncbi:MAG: hypothetical protein OXQ29_16545, partial [Rhodospirillaceae bacterium]|nr:hypothetical protein [Rhodospirillaceae bacterium]
MSSVINRHDQLDMTNSGAILTFTPKAGSGGYRSSGSEDWFTVNWSGAHDGSTGVTIGTRVRIRDSTSDSDWSSLVELPQGATTDSNWSDLVDLAVETT